MYYSFGCRLFREEITHSLEKQHLFPGGEVKNKKERKIKLRRFTKNQSVNVLIPQLQYIV